MVSGYARHNLRIVKYDIRNIVYSFFLILWFPAKDNSMKMPRLTASIFSDLLIYMIFFGLLMGLAFPSLMTLLGFDANSVYTAKFFFGIDAGRYGDGVH